LPSAQGNVTGISVQFPPSCPQLDSSAEEVGVGVQERPVGPVDLERRVSVILYVKAHADLDDSATLKGEESHDMGVHLDRHLAATMRIGQDRPIGSQPRCEARHLCHGPRRFTS
jgi:hypothetical protein